MELKEIQNLIKFVAKSGASEVKLEMDDVKITIKTSSEEKETTIVQQIPMGGMQQAPQMQQPMQPMQPRIYPSYGSGEKNIINIYTKQLFIYYNI